MANSKHLTDHFIIKKKYSALVNGSSDLQKLLKRLSIDTLVITGVGTNVCCESTARDAMMLGYKVIFVSDANATSNDYLHNVSLMNIKSFFGDVISTKGLIREFQESKSSPKNPGQIRTERRN